MKNHYDRPVRFICGDNWESEAISPDEKDGGYGIAILLAYLQGVPPRLNELADAIGTPPFTLEVAYKRLQINGIFSQDCSLFDPEELKMSKAITEEDIIQCAKAWCQIAGLASGFIGKAGLRQDMNPIRKQMRN